jgi:hypothetical protein
MALPRPRTRHENFVWKNADQIICRMEVSGYALHMQHRWHGAHWFLSNNEKVDAEIAELIIKDPRVAAVGDSLFEGEPGQTWRYAGGDFYHSNRRR